MPQHSSGNVGLVLDVDKYIRKYALTVWSRIIRPIHPFCGIIQIILYGSLLIAVGTMTNTQRRNLILDNLLQQNQSVGESCSFRGSNVDIMKVGKMVWVHFDSERLCN